MRTEHTRQKGHRMKIKRDKFLGCFMGLSIGDAFGASYEGGPIERLLWRLIGKTSSGKKRYTDDTQMSIDIAQSFLKEGKIEQDSIARHFAKSYRWSRGYGPSAAKLLKGIRSGIPWQSLNREKYKEGSKGNGAAMRAPVVVLCRPFNDEHLSQNIENTAIITHAHEEAIEGAMIIGLATCLALVDAPTEAIFNKLKSSSSLDCYLEKLAICQRFVESDKQATNSEIKSQLGNGIMALDSCVTALYFALRYREEQFSHMLDDIFSLGGDADTIAAMAGGIWGAFNGCERLKSLAEQVEDYELIEDLAGSLYQTYEQHSEN
jgi:poly(ADP-ribose) glycohydrolase ARH3